MATDWAQTAGGIEVATAATALEFVDTLRPSNPHPPTRQMAPRDLIRESQSSGGLHATIRSFPSRPSWIVHSISLSGIYFMRNGGKRPSIEELVFEANPDITVLRKLTLAHEHLADLIEMLRRENISRSALMPTMDNVAHDVRTKWSQQRMMA